MIFPTEEDKQKHLEEIEVLYDEYQIASSKTTKAYFKLEEALSWQDEDFKYFAKIVSPLEYLMRRVQVKKADLREEKQKEIFP